MRFMLRKRLHNPDDVFVSVPMEASELEKFPHLLDHRTFVGSSGHRHAEPATKVQESFVAQDT